MRRLRPARVFTTLASLSLIAACVAEDTEAPLRENAEALLFGEDDRVDYHEVEDEAWRALMRESIAAVVPTASIDASDPEDIRLDSESLQARAELCDDEPFVDQPTGANCTADEFALLDGCIGIPWPVELSLVFDYRYTGPGTLETITSDDVYEVVHLCGARLPYTSTPGSARPPRGRTAAPRGLVGAGPGRRRACGRHWT